MIEIKPAELKIIKEILCKLVPEFEVRVFGSRVKGNTKSYSDLDLALVGAKKLDLKLKFELKEALAESDLPFRVEILDWQTLSDDFKKIINQKYEVI